MDDRQKRYNTFALFLKDIIFFQYAMKNFIQRIRLIFGFMFFFFPVVLQAQSTKYKTFSKKSNFSKHIKITGLFYLAGQYKNQNKTADFAFLVRRAYLSVNAQISKNLSARYTQDITIDNQGNDAGNIELRVKYLYLQYKIPDFLFFTNTRLKFGIVQRPWLDFEEHINAYRVQGTMFMERSFLFNSAGFGISCQGLLGGRMNGEYVTQVHPYSPGKYGSFAFGIYNGGGYHQFERNMNKNFEARITIRPFPSAVPGLQFSYLGIFGKGNIPEKPDFVLNAGFVSYESRYVTVTAQYESGRGNSYGTFVDSTFSALPQHGFSFYSELKIPKTAFAVYARYDYFSLMKYGAIEINKRRIYGVSWRFLKQNKLVFSYQDSSLFNMPKSNIYDLALDISF